MIPLPADGESVYVVDKKKKQINKNGYGNCDLSH